jgi:hypothetical protein
MHVEQWKLPRAWGVDHDGSIEQQIGGVVSDCSAGHDARRPEQPLSSS